MFKRIPKKIATVLLGGIMLCSGIGMLSVSAAEETFVDDCNDLNKIFDSMKVEATGESVWEVIECPYVQGEKFIQRKELQPDPFGGWLVYGQEGSTIKDFKFTMNNFKFDYSMQINVYASADNVDYTKIPVKTSTLAEIGSQEYPDGAKDITSTFEITPDGALPADTAYIKLETLREHYGLGLRKAEITYINSGEKPGDNLRLNFKDDFSEEYAKTCEHSEGLAVTPNPDLKLDYLLGKTAPEAQYITYNLEECLDVTDGISLELEAYSITGADKAVNNLFAYVSDDGKNWTKIELKSTEQTLVSGQEYWEGCTLSGSCKGSPKFLKIEFKEKMDPNWLACLASVSITSNSSAPSTGAAFPLAAIVLVVVTAAALFITRKSTVCN